MTPTGSASEDPNSAEISSPESVHADWIIPAKLSPPRQQVASVDRSHLVNQLDSGLEAGLSLIVTPAGYGKTTLLSSWRRKLLEREVMAGWLTLDEDDADPTQLLSYIVMTLARAGVDMGEVEKAAGQGLVDIPLRTALANVVARIEAEDAPIVLILDDYHRAQCDSVDALLQGLISNQSANFHLVLSGRERPQLKLAEMRAQGHLQELGAANLRFSYKEAEQLFGPDLSQKDLTTLTERTEGWPVALQLARIWLAEKSDRASLIGGFSGRTNEIADYLAEQVLADLPENLQQFMMRTSILERFNGDLAEAVCEQENCWDILAKLERFNGLLDPLDNERHWYRYHHLFAQFLRDQLRRKASQRLPALHMAASQWYAKEGLLADATRHACLAGNYPHAAALVEDAGGWQLILQGGIGLLRKLLRNFPPEEMTRFPRLQLAQVYLFTKVGELTPARELMDQVREVTADFSVDGNNDEGGAKRALLRDGQLVEILLSRYEDRHLEPDGLQNIQRMVEDFTPDDAMARATVQVAYGLSALAMGELSVSRDANVSALRYFREANSVIAANYCYFHIGQCNLFWGRIREAEATYRESLAMAEDNFGKDSGLRAQASLLLSEILYEKNDLEGASAHIAPALNHAEELDGWFDIYASGYRTAAQLALAQDGIEAALKVIGRGEKTAKKRRLSRLSSLMKAERVRLLVLAGRTIDAEATALGAGLRFSPEEWRSDPYSWRVNHVIGLALAALSRALGKPEKALAILEDLKQACEAGDRNHHLLQVLTMMALCYQDLDNLDEATETLYRALPLAIPENNRRVFLDQGVGIDALLGHALRRGRERVLDSLTMTFLSELATALRLEEQGKSGLPAQDLLSPRETEVLAELALGRSNKEIARALDMTENTVKFHLKNIFAKFGVDNRTMAVVAARDRGLLGN